MTLIIPARASFGVVLNAQRHCSPPFGGILSPEIFEAWYKVIRGNNSFSDEYFGSVSSVNAKAQFRSGTA